MGRRQNLRKFEYQVPFVTTLPKIPIFQRSSQQTFKAVSYFQKITAFLHNGDNFPRFSSDTLLDTAKFAENYRSIIRFFLDKFLDKKPH